MWMMPPGVVQKFCFSASHCCHPIQQPSSLSPDLLQPRLRSYAREDPGQEGLTDRVKDTVELGFTLNRQKEYFG